MDFVVQHADTIRIANCSFGTVPRPDVPVELLRQATRAIVNAGVVLVASTGNNTRDIIGTDRIWGTSDDVYPAAFPETLAVSAMDDQDGLVGKDEILNEGNFSRVPHPPQDAIVVSPGAAIDVTAPGVAILSTFKDGQYALDRGTSMAAPHVSGLVGLYLLTHYVPRTAAGVRQVREALIAGAQPQSEWQTANTRDFDGNHEGLAVPSASWVPETRILSQQMTPPGFELQVATQIGWRYRYEYSPLFPASDGGGTVLPWSPLVTTNGTGFPVTVLDPGALTHPARLYRVRSEIVP
jgi:subtilisin family serine protease